MNKEQKVRVVGELKDKADRASIALVTDFKGMSVEEVTDLRQALRDADVDYVVVKNTLARIALSGGQHDCLSEQLKENNAIAWGYEEPVACAKTIVDFAKKSKFLKIKYASLDGSFLDEAQIKSLAELPGKDELRAMLLGTMNAVPQNFVGLMANMIRGVVNVLNAVKDQKEAA